MQKKPISLVNIYYEGGDKRQSVGRLASNDQKLLFEYSENFLETGIQLSPFKLPLKSGVMSSGDSTFQGLFGLLNDSLPDGWGRLLLDRKLLTQDVNPRAVSPMERLCYVGKRFMGALTYEPVISNEKPYKEHSLDELAEEIVEFQEEDNDRCVDELLALAGSSAGARPKVILTINGEEWLVKFRSQHDFKDSGAIEYAYHLMAKKAGLDVPSAKLFPAKEGVGYFGVKRFDRLKEKPVHMHSLGGLLHADHRVPSLDYEMILKATNLLTKDALACEKQFRAAVFNVLSHNRDDHAKNFSFLMSDQGVWSVSPAYDLIFSSGPRGEHCTLVMGEGKEPRLMHLLKLADCVGIKPALAKDIINEVRDAVSEWPGFASDAGVSQPTMNIIHKMLLRTVLLN